MSLGTQLCEFSRMVTVALLFRTISRDPQALNDMLVQDHITKEEKIWQKPVILKLHFLFCNVCLLSLKLL